MSSGAAFRTSVAALMHAFAAQLRRGSGNGSETQRHF